MYSSVSPTIRITAWVLVTIIISILSVSFVAKIEIIARGTGKTVPIDKVRIVQAQENGKVVALWVKEGDSVEAGQPLLSLDKTEAQSQIDTIASEIDKQLIEQKLCTQILEAMQKSDPALPRFLEHKADQSPVISATLKTMQDEVIALDADIAKIQAARKTQNVKIIANTQESELAQKQYNAALNLQKTGTISQFTLLERDAELKKSQNNLIIAEREYAEMNASEIERIKQRIKIISQNKSTYETRKKAAEIALNGLYGQLKLQKSRLKNTDLIAPISGKVENLTITTTGAFVEAGKPALTIVPSGGKLEIEAYIENKDIGFLRTGQTVFVKFDAFPAERFGIVKGSVVRVGADARDEKSALLVYMVRIALEKNHILSESKPIPFVAGMSATVDIVTGERRVISYFFEPITKAIQDSFGER